MRHGDMDIFHRHAQANGRGAVQFSLANAFEPGIFDLKKVDDLETRGLALFMALPGPAKPMKAYDLMVKTARGITQELGGYVLDASKSNFSKQIESHHREQIVEFERKQLLNK
jgi:cell division protein ZipA